MKKLLLVVFVGCFFFSEAQNPLVKMWDKRFGGTAEDRLYSFQQTSDGGFILSGQSYSSASGDKSQNVWGGFYPDYWIVKTDSLGNKQWDKDFGGVNTDALYSIQQTADGGFILAGISLSGISGDKTQPVWGGSGDYDYWIVKTDSLGNKQWDKDFGGTDWDNLYSIQQTTDGGYILGGYSASPLSGDKTQNTWLGSTDYWIVKIDSLGSKQWDKDFGGTNNDLLYSVRQTADGGYILGGYSLSPMSGDKTQDTVGDWDYWIVKTDSLGNKQWDKDFGGTDFDKLYSLQQTADGGFILGGYSQSGIGGDKTQQPWGNKYWTGFDSVYYTDYWIIKTDSLGNKQWDKDFGGTDTEDEFGNITQTADGGYLIAGTSYSSISGDKTEANLGQEQSWIIKTDSLGNKQWDKTIFTTAHDEQGLGIKTRDGCYAFANFTNGGIGGFKTQPNWDTVCAGAGCTPDYWIVKFCDSTFISNVTANATAVNNLCPGTCTNFTNLSTNATTYQWSFPGAIPNTSTAINPTNICYNTPGQYDVTLIASNSNGSDTLTLSNYITVYPFPPTLNIVQSGDTLFATTGLASYQWYYNTVLINGATNSFYVAGASGDYNVSCLDSNGCSVEAGIFNVVAAVSPLSFGEGLGVRLFPNPVTDKLVIQNLKVISEKAEIKIYNMLGEKVYSVFHSGQLTVDCRLFSPGVYFVEVSAGEKVFRGKFVKQ